MARIVILGCAGTGKTTLARRLAARLGAEPICLDAIWPEFCGDLVEFRHEVERLHAGESWISDGNFAAVTFLVRLPRATQIVWLERSRLHCAWRVTLRALTRGTDHRPADLPSVLRFIWNFERTNRPRIERFRLDIAPEVPVLRLRDEREVAAFVAALTPRAPTAAA